MQWVLLKAVRRAALTVVEMVPPLAVQMAVQKVVLKAVQSAALKAVQMAAPWAGQTDILSVGQ